MKQILFLGDSITDCYHSFDPDNLGEGYVRMIAESLHETHSAVNKGVDGFTLLSVKRMWNQVSSVYKPDIINILVGINDIYMIETTDMDKTFALEEFKLGYKTLIESIQRQFSGPIILMEPFVFPKPEEYKNWYQSLRKMNLMIQNITEQYHLTYIPLWEDLLEAAEKQGLDEITIDGVHLTEKGHTILKEKWLEYAKAYL